MNNKNNIPDTENLKDNAPTLFNLKKENSFKVPQLYFDELPTKIQNQVIHQSKYQFQLQFKWIVPVAASLILVIVLLTNVNQQNNSLEDLSAQEIQQVLEFEGYYNVDTDLLAVVYSDETNNNEITNEEIIDYLIYENMDVDAIYY